jgi:NADH pyrophosphatase NudC (nudix superfamily)
VEIKMAEPKFVAKPGQIDYTNVRYCPVFNSVATYNDKILMLKRSSELRLYPGLWSGVSGFLDDHHSLEEKIAEEFYEELSVNAKDIALIQRGKVIVRESQKYNKTWIILTAHVTLKSDKIKLDWEAEKAEWFKHSDLAMLETVPGYLEIVDQFDFTRN